MVTKQRKPRLANQATLMTPAELATRHRAMLDKAVILLRNRKRDDKEMEHGETHQDK
jgi:hypothetical protein